MIIRPATTEDALPIWKFVCALEETHFDYTLFQQQYQHNFLKKDTTHLVAVEATGIMVGYISCHGQFLLHHAAKVFEIQELFVAEAYRNKKIGQLLIEVLEKQLQQGKHEFLEVSTNINRTNAHRFYERCGFTKTHYKFTKKLK